MIKFYLPDGHLEPRTVELFERAGFRLSITERSYCPTIDDPAVEVKRLRPQDFPYLLSIGKGDLAIVGLDILKEFELGASTDVQKPVDLMDLGFHASRLVVALSEEVYPEIETTEAFAAQLGRDDGEGLRGWRDDGR